MADLRHNERVKLVAAWLNTAAGASFAIGVLAPLAATFYSATVPVPRGPLIIGIVLWFAAAIALHCLAQWVLGGLRE